MRREELFDAKDVGDLFRRYSAYLGRPPTVTELRAMVNTVLGPWVIQPSITGKCTRED